jgi:hypothetical protein
LTWRRLPSRIVRTTGTDTTLRIRRRDQARTEESGHDRAGDGGERTEHRGVFGAEKLCANEDAEAEGAGVVSDNAQIVRGSR